jgi:pimeloyl-ACP methyl ester carboxylesterase
MTASHGSANGATVSGDGGATPARDTVRDRAHWEESADLGRRRFDGTRQRDETWGMRLEQDALRHLAFLARAEGDLARARDYRERALALARALPGAARVPFELVALGDTKMLQGDERAARQAFEEVLTVAVESDHAGLRHQAASRLAALNGDVAPPPPPAVGGNGLLLDVGGHRLYARCWRAMAPGRPTVVFESGLGDAWGQWRYVAPKVAGFAGAVVYSRAGIFPSEPGPLPRTFSRIATDLRALLGCLGCRPPFVLVGHSVGARTQRMYAALFPREVSALVLLDGFDEQPPDERERENAALPEEERRRRDWLFDGGNPVEHIDFRTSWCELAGAPRLPDVPVVCVASRWAAGNFTPLVAATGRAKDLVATEQVVRRTYGAGAGFVVAERSGHYIHVDQPDLVVETVRSLVQS